MKKPPFKTILFKTKNSFLLLSFLVAFVSLTPHLFSLSTDLTIQSTRKPMGTSVGELQEKWQFPSDHLPIGMSFEGIHFLSWNVLDPKYMSWVTEKNSQGLNRSLIAKEHVYLNGSQLTLRELHIAQQIRKMISHPTHPRRILCLQECSEPFLETLRTQLPSCFQIISLHGESIILDMSRFKLIESKKAFSIFTHQPFRTIQEILIQRLDNGQYLRLINVHLPGDPNQPNRFEFTAYLAQTFDPTITTIVMGDMNFNELEMEEALRKSFKETTCFSVYSPYCTNISPFTFESKAIDHFIVFSPNKSAVELNTPAQIMEELERIVSLLEK